MKATAHRGRNVSNDLLQIIWLELNEQSTQCLVANLVCLLVITLMVLVHMYLYVWCAS